MFNRYNNEQQRTAEGAITEYFAAIQFRDENRLAEALCDDEKAKANNHITSFYDRLASAGFELQSLSWIPSQGIPEQGKRHTVTGFADVAATKGAESFDVEIGYRVTVEKKLLTWRVCSAEQIS